MSGSVNLTFGSQTSTTTSTSSTSSEPTQAGGGFASSDNSSTSSTTSTSSITSTASSQQQAPTVSATPSQATSTPASSLPDQSHSSSSVAPGAVAGIAIGCFLAGIFLAVFMSLFVLRSKTKRHGRRHNENDKRPRDSEKLEVTGTGGHTFSKSETTVEDILPQRADDNTLKMRVSSVLAQVDNYIGNYYQTKRVVLEPSLEGDLSRFDTQHLPAPLAACFEGSERPTHLLKHCLSYYVVTLTLSPSVKTQTLIPIDMANALSDIDSRRGQGGRQRDFDLVFSQWKVLNAYLRPGLYDDPRSVDPGIEKRCAAAAHDFCKTFRIWAQEEFSEDERIKQLTTILYAALTTSMWLLSQPDSLEFSWSVKEDVRDRHPRRAALLPRVSKTTYGGVRLEKPQVLIEPVVRSV